MTSLLYLNEILNEIAEDRQFARDAIEFCVDNDIVKLAGDRLADVREIMKNYDNICRAYHRYLEYDSADVLGADFGVPVTELTTGY